MMGVPFLDLEPMNADEFFAFTATRPDDEKWELIEGEPILNASASRLHQEILGNILLSLGLQARQPTARWEILPGIGVRISDIAVPVHDLIIRPNDDLEGAECDDILVAIEILSPSTANHDLRWKRKTYATLPSLSHYVVVAQDAVEVVSYDRANGFAERRLESADVELDLPVVAARLSLRDIYRDTGLLPA
jgi:Uma2 family endonuclease